MQVVIDFFNNHRLLTQVAQLLLSIVIALVVVFVLFRVQRRITQELYKRKKNLNTKMIENGFKFLVIFLAVQWVLMSSDLTRDFANSIFQGTAVLAAIAGFAAQNVLADVLCGMVISGTKPFEIGDRIELDNGTSGIVADMTLRHVTLKGIDTQMFIIPNSQMNKHEIRNLSWHTKTRSVDFRFNLSYNVDPEEARKVIRQAIKDSPLSVPGKDTQGGHDGYADVYFLAIEEYSLLMATTAYYPSTVPTEVFKTDINTRVYKAVTEHGMEFPYRIITLDHPAGSV